MVQLFESFSGDVSANDFKAAVWLGQTFTPQVTHDLTSVKLKLYRVGGAGGQIGSVYSAIRAVDGDHKPTGASLVTSNAITATTITTSSPGELYEFVFNSSHRLLIDVEYAIIAYTTGGDSSNFIQGRYNNSGGYARGLGWRSSDSGSTWSAHGDWAFEEWGNLYVPVATIGKINKVGTGSIAKFNRINLSSMKKLRKILL